MCAYLINLRIIFVFLLIDSNDAQSKLDLHSPYNLHEELKKILFVHKKEKIHACANRVEFQFLISCFHNYEVNYTVMICMSVYLYMYAYVSVCFCLSVHLCVCVCIINFLGSDKERITG